MISTDRLNNSNDDFSISQILFIKKYLPYSHGLCQGLAIEYSRHKMHCELKGKIPNFNGKLFKKLKYYSPNFIERINSYQEYFRVKNSSSMYRSEVQLLNLFNDFKSATFIGIEIRKIQSPCYGHWLILNTPNFNHLSITNSIYDSNYGEFTNLTSLKACYDQIISLISDYSIEWKTSEINVTARDFGSLMNSWGMLPSNTKDLKAAKYFYRFYTNLSNNRINLEYQLGLSVIVKIDALNIFKIVNITKQDLSIVSIPTLKSAFDQVIENLNTEEIIRLVASNTHFNLYKSLPSIFLTLITYEKFNAPIIGELLNNHLLNKKNELVLKDHKAHYIKNVLSELYNVAYWSSGISYQSYGNKVEVKAVSDNKFIKRFFDQIAYKSNKELNKFFSLHSKFDTNCKYVFSNFNSENNVISITFDYDRF